MRPMLKPTLSARFSRLPERVPGTGSAAPAAAAALLWLLAALVCGYWLLHFWGRSPLTPVAAIAGNPLQADASMVARALGALPEAPASAPIVPAVSSRFRLLGLVGQPGQRGAALIAVDGQPPRPVSVGAVVEGQLLLLSVDRRAVRVGLKRDDPAAFELGLPQQEE
jgi:general secretion pathway protein C